MTATDIPPIVIGRRAGRTWPCCWRPTSLFLSSSNARVFPNHPSEESYSSMAAVIQVPDQAEVLPGAVSQVPIRLLNSSQLVDRFTFELEGPAAEWSAIEPNQVNLLPADTATVLLYLSPASSPAPRAGLHDVRITARSAVEPEIVATSEVRVTVLQIADLSAEIVPSPSRSSRSAHAALHLSNGGNTAVVLHLSLIDVDGQLTVTLPESISLGPSSTADIPLRIRARRFMFGAPIARRFGIALAPNHGQCFQVFSKFIQLPTVRGIPAIRGHQTRQPEPTPTAADHETSRLFRLLSDHPVARADDLLEFRHAAWGLAAMLLGATDATPITLGVQGSWGSGKSSLMSQIREELEEQASALGWQCRTLWFNAWTAEGASGLAGLVKSVLAELDPKVLRRLIRRSRAASSWLRIAVVLAGASLGLGRLTDEVWRRFSLDAQRRNELREHLRSAMKDWVDQAPKLGMRRLLVIFVDDLDRCSPANVLEILEAIRLYLDAPGFAFVVGYDAQRITEALMEGKTYSTPLAVREYLEKIIQVDYRLPPPSGVQAEALAQSCLRQSGAKPLVGDAEVSLIIERTNRNPRRLKRFLNHFVMAQELDPNAAHFSSAELIRLLLLRIFFPEVYQLIVVERDRDLLADFLELARIRGALAAGNDPGEEQVLALMRNYDLGPKPTESLEDSVNRLEREMPASLVALARDRDFLVLAWSLGERGQREDLLRRLRAEPLDARLIGAVATEDSPSEGVA